MDSATLLEKAKAATDNATVGRVFGDPVERDGIVLLPVAKVSAGGGGGSGSGFTPTGDAAVTDQKPGQGEGSGAGYGLHAEPAGVFILRDGEVTWKPALDINKIILGGQAVAVVALLVARSILRRHLRHHH